MSFLSIHPELEEPELQFGDLHPLVDQLGSTEGMVALEEAWSLVEAQPVKNLESLRRFLWQYQRRFLVPFELPIIRKAYNHATHNELREMISLDCSLNKKGEWNPFKVSSRRIGQFQLRCLRPMRDERFVQRYIRAIDDERATGWHTLVYGLTLALYSLPLRQGLLHYAFQVHRGFIHSASSRLVISVRDSRFLMDELAEPLLDGLDKLFEKDPER